ncbi:MAG: hypothetical protein SGJ27_14720 [Candidatus Melainabacteria bacterium]|nr:hypothetical protein [Candidatus Melainabacteria bacterium]
MNDQNGQQEATQSKLELEWLAQYFYTHGQKEKARDIMDRLRRTGNSNINNVVDIETNSANSHSRNVVDISEIESDEERRA